MTAAIRQAQKTVNLETYHLSAGRGGQAVPADAMMEAARRGVRSPPADRRLGSKLGDLQDGLREGRRPVAQ